jgi:CDP-diacylglycerol--glycerol-3-phosphate 3-phosphatidyltransferase
MGWNQYAAAWAVQHGGYDARRAPAAVRGWLRLGYGVARLLALVRLRPGKVTMAGLALAVAVPLLAGRGAAGPLVAAGLVLLSILAGSAARALGIISSRPSPRAAIGQAVADRLGEVAWLVGFWVAGVPTPLVLAAAALTVLYEYVREQALAAGMSLIATQTTGDRATRAVMAVAGLALAGLAGLAGRGGFAGERLGSGLLTVAAGAWLLLTALGLGQLSGALNRSVP